MSNREDSICLLPQRLVGLRAGLLGGLTLAVLLAPTFLDIRLPLGPLLGVLAILAVFNWRHAQCAAAERTPAEAATQLTVDLVGLGVLLFLSGGAANPLVFLLLFPVAVAALCLPVRWVALVAALAIGLYSLLMVYYVPLPIVDIERATRLHLAGMWLTFVVSATMAAWFISRMTRSIRNRDAELAAVREQALRDAQVVALGQLAAGAAHELGTPLATMNVLVGELRQDPRLPDEMGEDLALLGEQIAACKEIIGSLTQQAGIERAVRSLAVADWLDGLLSRWRSQWPRINSTRVTNGRGAMPHLVVSAALEQALVNLLNNAARAATTAVRLQLDWDDHTVRVTVADDGPGYPPDMLKQGGAEPVPGQTAGMGIGLWLARSAVERHGGRLILQNGADGAFATVALPRMHRRGKQ